MFYFRTWCCRRHLTIAQDIMERLHHVRGQVPHLLLWLFVEVGRGPDARRVPGTKFVHGTMRILATTRPPAGPVTDCFAGNFGYHLNSVFSVGACFAGDETAYASFHDHEPACMDFDTLTDDKKVRRFWTGPEPRGKIL